jgi:hypothetical protein
VSGAELCSAELVAGGCGNPLRVLTFVSGAELCSAELVAGGCGNPPRVPTL